MDNTLLNNLRRVAIYGRVSTEHEAQLSAFENQQAWYDDLTAHHPEWRVVERYFDRGITGTAAKKRPAFLKMLADAKAGMFDLIVTREVCRFARNTVDTLSITRDLKRLGVEVYFVNDNIRTMDGDGELRLSIMATLAQEESRKISERVRAGQAVSREKGVLYGNGNILGYDRVNGTYAINPEQALTVRKIFELYAAGLGYKKICAELMHLGYRNSHGTVDWKVDRIGRILRNATYAGYIGFNKSHSDSYLTQRRINHGEEDFVYVKGDFPPIISEELWQRCAAIRKSKSRDRQDMSGQPRRAGRKTEPSIWNKKLRCSCGSAFRRYKWRQNADGTTAYGYECYRRARGVPPDKLRSVGLEDAIVCDSHAIPGWQLDLMSKKVFATVWQDQRDAVVLACQMLEDCAEADREDQSSLIAALTSKLERLHRKDMGLREMRALGDITREQFLSDQARLQDELEATQHQLDMLRSDGIPAGPVLDIKAIRNTLEQWVDLSVPAVADELIDRFIRRVDVLNDTTYRWQMDLTAPEKQAPLDAPFADILPPAPESEPQELFRFQVTTDDAAAYCAEIHMRFFRSKWKDKTVIITL